MPHVAMVPFTGLRLREREMRALGMSLPGLRQRGAAIAQLPATGLLTLAGMTPPHWTCSLHETDVWDEALVERILSTRPTLVALSALTASIDEAYRFSTHLRARGARTVVGGLHATACSEEASRYCNAVVAGEGEPVWPQVLADAEAGTLRPIYRSARPFDLAHAPLPRFDLLGSQRRPRFTLQTQRGCPLACDFCGASRLLGPFREKPVVNIARELAAIAAIAPHPVIELADDNTFAGARPVGPLFDALSDSGARWFTEADWRIGERGDVLAGLARSGCVQALVGIESLVFRHAGMGSKQTDLSRMSDAVRAIQETGVAVIACFIVGCDGETRASMDALAEFVAGFPAADIQLTLQTPFPGTALHRRLQREGRMLADRGWSHHTLFDVTYRPDLMSVPELEAGFRDLLRQVYSHEESARRAAIRRDVWNRHPRLHPCASRRSFDT